MLVCILLGLVLFVLGEDLEKDLSFKRASCPLAKTGSSVALETTKNQCVFEVFRCLGLSRCPEALNALLGDVCNVSGAI